jgi:ppGpp synthetase/RelA/SpoT-type nucleotidyltranferase
MSERTVEDRLREEYFDLLPQIRRVLVQLEGEIAWQVLPISRKLRPHEQLIVKSRVKQCDSALEALRRRQEGATFDLDQPELYTLTSLKNLAGVRILAFPRNLLIDIGAALRERFGWHYDPVHDEHELLALKYTGYCQEGDQIRGEYQIVSMLTGLFWEVEHSAIYKPEPRLRGFALSAEMKQRSRGVLDALKAFEEEFEDLVQETI